MGTPIGQVPSTLIAARRQPPAIEPVAPRNDRPSFDLNQANNRPEANPNRSGSDATETPQAGFGPGTVSGPAAALVTLGRGVRAAREAIPTLDEIRDQFQANSAARNAELTAETEAVRTRIAERREQQQTTVPAADPLGFSRFNEAREFTELANTEPVPFASGPASEALEAPSGPAPQFASARPPEAPEFASAEQPEESTAPEPPGLEPGFPPVNVQRERLDLTA